MAIIDYIDPETRSIYLHSDTVGADLHPIDIYKEMRTLRRIDENLRKYDLFLGAAGNVSKGAGSFTERYVVCLNGTRIVPFNISQQLKVVGTIITDEGTSGRDCFNRLPLGANVEVDIDYQPPQVEIIQVSSGSGLSNQQNTILTSMNQMMLALYQMEGLDPQNPMTMHQTQRIAGNITQSITQALDSITIERTS